MWDEMKKAFIAVYVEKTAGLKDFDFPLNALELLVEVKGYDKAGFGTAMKMLNADFRDAAAEYAYNQIKAAL